MDVNEYNENPTPAIKMPLQVNVKSETSKEHSQEVIYFLRYTIIMMFVA